MKVCEQDNQISHKYSSVQSTSKNWIFQTHMQGCRRENFTINIQLHLNDMNAEFISEWEWQRERNPAGDQVQCKGVMIRQWSVSLAYHCCDVATLTAFTSSHQSLEGRLQDWFPVAFYWINAESFSSQHSHLWAI